MTSVSPLVVGIFLAFCTVTLAITFWANRRTGGTREFYVAGGRITAGQNGLALAGDYLSAASFLGIVAVFFSLGVDGLLYAVGAVAGWPIALFLIAEPLRNIGRYTFADVLCTRLSEKPMRVLAASSTLCLVATYLVAQLVGAGTLVQIVFGIPYRPAVITAGCLMIVYVCFGGMLATTWIQIVKASILLGTAAAIAGLSLRHFGTLDNLIASAATAHSSGFYLEPGKLVSDPFSAISLGLAFALGPAGLPHVLMRFLTVPDARAARIAITYATCIIGGFQFLAIILGYSAAALVNGNGIVGGPNMAALHLAHALGGDLLEGITAAVAFATILAVVSGLALTGASAVSHDLYRQVLRSGRENEATELLVSRVATVALGAVVVIGALAFQHQNVGFLSTLPLVIAASVNAPLLLLAIYWRGLTTSGALAGGVSGLVLSVVLLAFSPKVWVETLGHPHALFPFEYPTLICLGSTLVLAYLVSICGQSARAGLRVAGD